MQVERPSTVCLFSSIRALHGADGTIKRNLLLMKFMYTNTVNIWYKTTSQEYNSVLKTCTIKKIGNKCYTYFDWTEYKWCSSHDLCSIHWRSSQVFNLAELLIRFYIKNQGLAPRNIKCFAFKSIFHLFFRTAHLLS